MAAHKLFGVTMYTTATLTFQQVRAAGLWLTQVLTMINQRPQPTIRRLLLPLAVTYVATLEFREEFVRYLQNRCAAVTTLSPGETERMELRIPHRVQQHP